jgi:hypothetical protein
MDEWPQRWDGQRDDEVLADGKGTSTHTVHRP